MKKLDFEIDNWGNVFVDSFGLGEYEKSKIRDFNEANPDMANKGIMAVFYKLKQVCQAIDEINTRLDAAFPICEHEFEAYYIDSTSSNIPSSFYCKKCHKKAEDISNFKLYSEEY